MAETNLPAIVDWMTSFIKFFHSVYSVYSSVDCRIVNRGLALSADKRSSTGCRLSMDLSASFNHVSLPRPPTNHLSAAAGTVVCRAGVWESDDICSLQSACFSAQRRAWTAASKQWLIIPRVSSHCRVWRRGGSPLSPPNTDSGSSATPSGQVHRQLGPGRRRRCMLLLLLWSYLPAHLCQLLDYRLLSLSQLLKLFHLDWISYAAQVCTFTVSFVYSWNDMLCWIFCSSYCDHNTLKINFKFI